MLLYVGRAPSLELLLSPPADVRRLGGGLLCSPPRCSPLMEYEYERWEIYCTVDTDFLLLFSLSSCPFFLKKGVWRQGLLAS